MAFSFNRKTLASSIVAVSAAGVVGVLTQGCVPACDPDTDPTCPIPPISVGLDVSLDANKLDTPYIGGQEVVVTTPSATEDERDLRFAFGGGIPDANCPEVYDGSAIQIKDDVQFRVLATTESEKWLDTRSKVYKYYIEQPTYPNAALKDAWLAAEVKAVENHLLCASGLDADGPDANGKCDYPETPTPGTNEFWNLVLSPKNWTAACENTGSGTVTLDYVAVWDYDNNVMESVDIDITYSNCTLDGVTYTGTTIMDMQADNLLTFDVVSNISTSGAVTGTFREQGVRVYDANLSEKADKRFGDYWVSCSNAGCEANDAEVQWNCPTIGNAGTTGNCKGNYWLIDPSMVNGCPTTNVEADPDPAS